MEYQDGGRGFVRILIVEDGLTSYSVYGERVGVRNSLHIHCAADPTDSFPQKKIIEQFH
ncbi:MAG: hypothetical protein PWQ29_1680 [Verrucomicrobiota bacterium]|jgi:hypothetical protein|nr:hypothetical protein [Verrucomicrobiota bacterium]MDK2964286.1 hypothetical protein [Verrucomicrobiota bacterium]